MRRMLYAVLPALLLSACSNEQGYNAVKGWQKNECNHRVDNADREKCLKDANTNYEKYREQTSI